MADPEELDRIDREVASLYHDMVRYCAVESKEIKILGLKYFVRANLADGRVRGLHADIYLACVEYLSGKLQPGLLIKHIEQARAEIERVTTTPGKKTTLMTLSPLGLVDSLRNGPQEFKESDFESLADKNQKFWDSNSQQRQNVIAQLKYHFKLSDRDIEKLLQQTTDINVITHKAKQLYQQQHMNPVQWGQTIDDDDTNDGDDDEEEVTIKAEDILTLKSMLGRSDDECKSALIRTKGDVNSAAELLLRESQ